MENIRCYRMKMLTDLHVGDGEVNYNIIDNEVEKDPVSSYPVIFSSGVKGALREHLSGCAEEELIFGDDNTKRTAKSKPGRLKFTAANLLGLPMRASKGDKSHYIVTSKSLLRRLLELERDIRGCAEARSLLEALEREKEGISTGKTEIAVEGIAEIKEGVASQPLKEWMNSWLGEDAILLAEKDLRQHRLPVQARNALKNGESVNLWYEEYVPHESVFYTYAIEAKADQKETAFSAFVSYLEERPLVQFGGNASIGFGLTRMTPMEEMGK